MSTAVRTCSFAIFMWYPLTDFHQIASLEKVEMVIEFWC